MNAPNNVPAAAAPGHMGTVALPAQVRAQWLLWLSAAWFFGIAVLLGGMTAGTIALGAMMGAVASVLPRTGLWLSVVYLVYTGVFYIHWTVFADVEETGYVGAAIGLALIALGLGVAWFREGRRRWPRPNAALKHFDHAMLAMLGMTGVATCYGIGCGNGVSQVIRQLFGYILLVGYYLFARTFFRSGADIYEWLRKAAFVTSAGAAWYTMKMTYLSLSAGAYTREQSTLSFFAGAVGALLFAEYQWERDRRRRLVTFAAFSCCALACLMMGARLAAASMAGTVIIIMILRRNRQRLLIGLVTLALVTLAAAFMLSYLPSLVQQGGLTGGIAERFSPSDLDQDVSYIARMSQLYSIAEVVREHPILGGGMGAEITYYDPGSDDPSRTAAYVDNGWGFLLLKMGFAGLLVFVATLWRFLRFAAGDWPSDGPMNLARVRACLLALLLFGALSFIGGPTFFHFTNAGFLGTTLGGLAALAHISECNVSVPNRTSRPQVIARRNPLR